MSKRKAIALLMLVLLVLMVSAWGPCKSETDKQVEPEAACIAGGGTWDAASQTCSQPLPGPAPNNSNSLEAACVASGGTWSQGAHLCIHTTAPGTGLPTP